MYRSQGSPWCEFWAQVVPILSEKYPRMGEVDGGETAWWCRSKKKKIQRLAHIQNYSVKHTKNKKWKEWGVLHPQSWMRGSQWHHTHECSSHCRPSVWFYREGFILFVTGATPTSSSLVSRHHQAGNTKNYYFVVDGGGHAAHRISVSRDLKPDHGSESSES